VLMADNLGAHISTRVMELCTEYNIRWVGTYLTGTVPVGTGTLPYCTVPTILVPNRTLVPGTVPT